MLVACSALLVSMVAARPSSAQLNTPVPELQEVGVDEHLDEPLPLDLSFRDASGRERTLGSYFEEGRPVVISFNYTDCPLLCSRQLDGLVAAMREVDQRVGEDYVVLSISIDPGETHHKARSTQVRYLQQLGQDGAASGFDFLTGSPRSIRLVTGAVGFRYKYLPKQGEYSHPAVITLCTPDGRISRYLYGLDYNPRTFELSLVEASEGGIGSTVDRVLLFCFHYDATEGRYGPAAYNLMRLGGTLTLVILLAFLVPVWVRSAMATPAEPDPTGGGVAEAALRPSGEHDG